MFNPANRKGRAANPFPGLVTVNALALPAGEPAPTGIFSGGNGLVEITDAGADWRAAAWALRCDGTWPISKAP